MDNTINLNAMSSEEIRDMTKPKRLDAVDIAKGILIFLVVLSHAWFANSNILGDFVPFSMPAFFFLSGYTYKPGRKYYKNMLKRVVGLIIPYFAFGCACNMLYPWYSLLSTPQMKVQMNFSYWQVMMKSKACKAAWMAMLKADALNMLMNTPMWFLAALFVASIIFFAIADKVRKSLAGTGIACAVLVAITIGIELVKKSTLPWFIDLCPYAVAMMLIGSYCGEKKLFAKMNVKWAVIGIACLLIGEVVNRIFPGSGKTSVVEYITNGAWYGVLTAFVIAVTGSIGTLCVAKLLEKVPVVRNIFKYMGRNSIWILCIHYCAIMLIELKIYNMGWLTNSIMEVVSAQIFGFGQVNDTAKDIVLKLAVAIISILVGLLYALIHNAIKKQIKKIGKKEVKA